MLRKNKKGVLAIYIYFMMIAGLIVLVSAVLAPMGVLFNSQMYAAGEDILIQANESIESIQDTEIKEKVNDIVATAHDDALQNIEINASIFQYGWVFVIAITAIIFFILARQLVEYGGGNLV